MKGRQLAVRMTLCQTVTPHLMKLKKTKVSMNSAGLGSIYLQNLEWCLGVYVQQFVFHRESPVLSVNLGHCSGLGVLCEAAAQMFKMKNT